MKKIVPFKKEISLGTNIYEIKSISLEHNLSLKENNIVEGQFILSGSYRMTETSLNIDEFNYKLPFEITIDKKYDTKDLVVDINDFYYEVIDNKTISVNIEVIVDNLEEKEFKETLELEKKEDTKKQLEENNNDTERKEEKKEENINDRNEIISSIFDDLDNNDNYVTYKVHVVGENDTVETIIQKYKISESTLNAYNDLSNIKIGDKIIIPLNDKNK